MKKYAIATVTSMGLRITPQDRMAVQNSNLFYLQATSAESNVLNVSSSLGKECLVMTKFVAVILSSVSFVPATSVLKARMSNRAVPGVTDISST